MRLELMQLPYVLLLATILLQSPKRTSAFFFPAHPEEVDCDACEQECDFLDFTCYSAVSDCRGYAAIVNGVTAIGAAICATDPIAEDARDLVHAATDLLVNKNLFAQEEIDAVEIHFCVFIGGFASGHTPSIDKILLRDQNRFTSVSLLASLLAHEMFHIRQYNRWGARGFGCRYMAELLKGNGFVQPNAVEVEAYDYQYDIASPCIFQGENCPE